MVKTFCLHSVSPKKECLVSFVLFCSTLDPLFSFVVYICIPFSAPAKVGVVYGRQRLLLVLALGHKQPHPAVAWVRLHWVALVN